MLTEKSTNSTNEWPPTPNELKEQCLSRIDHLFSNQILNLLRRKFASYHHFFPVPFSKGLMLTALGWLQVQEVPAEAEPTFSPFTGTGRLLDGKASKNPAPPIASSSRTEVRKPEAANGAKHSTGSSSQSTGSRQPSGKLVFGSNVNHTPKDTPKVAAKETEPESPKKEEESKFKAWKKYSLKEDEREFSYYGGSDNGPEQWGTIHEDWEACSNGEMQSPIDLLNKRIEILPRLGRLRSYKPAHASLRNRGHDIMVLIEGFDEETAAVVMARITSLKMEMEVMILVPTLKV